MVSLDDFEIDRWDGDKIYLKGSVRGIVQSDEICVVFVEPGDSTHHNIPSTVSEIQYVYFKDTSGDYDFAANGRYLPYTKDGYYGIRCIDVSGNCENWSEERDLDILTVIKEEVPELPDIFQY
jgi:hypothetical protein